MLTIVQTNPTVQSVSEPAVSKSSIPELLVSEALSESPPPLRACLDLNTEIAIADDLNPPAVDVLSLNGSCLKRSTTSPPLGLKAEIQIFLSTFLTIFLAEIGDKTQLTILLMSAESQSPWLVFLGAGLALIATSLCGVLLGKWLSTRISPKALDTSAGLLLLFIAALLTWDFFQAN